MIERRKKLSENQPPPDLYSYAFTPQVSIWTSLITWSRHLSQLTALRLNLSLSMKYYKTINPIKKANSIKFPQPDIIMM